MTIIAKHSTCAKAMLPRKRPCRNCENKKVWRRECTEACNTFFLYAVTSVPETLTTLAPLVLNTVTMSVDDVNRYANFAPKINFSQRKKMLTDERIQSMLQRERNFRFSILNGGTGRVNASYHHQRSFAGDDLLQLLMDSGTGLEATLDDAPRGSGASTTGSADCTTTSGGDEESGIPAVRETAIIMGFPEDWLLPTSTRAAIKALGNAVPPPLSHAIMRAACAADTDP